MPRALRELPVLGELAVQLALSVLMEQTVQLAQAQPVPQAQRGRPVPQVRLVVLERLVLSVQVLLGHLAGWVRSVQREQLVLPVLGELAVQLVRPVPRALWVR